MKSLQSLLFAGAALFATTAAQQTAHGADVAQALKIAQAATQGEIQHGHFRGHEADKNQSARQPKAGEHGKPGHAEHKAEQKHAKPVANSDKSEAKPPATSRAVPRDARHQESEHRRNEMRQRSENDQHNVSGKHPTAAQKETPAVGRTENTLKENKHKAEQAEPKHGKPNQTKESAKPAPQKSRQVEQPKNTQPSGKPAKNAAEQPAQNAPRSGQQPPSAQKEGPVAGQPEKNHMKAEETKPEQGKPNQAKESAKPSPHAQPPGKSIGTATQRPAQNPNHAAEQPGARNVPKIAAVPPPPTKPRSASDFIRRQGEKAGEGLNEVRRNRHETRQGNLVVIREGDRTIERENNRAIIRHRESDRFAVGARDVNVERHNDQTVTIVVRPNGVRIISTTDRDGHLIRRVRRDPQGREIVIIDDSRFAPRRRDEIFVDVPPPRIDDRDRYIVEADRVDRRRIYDVFTAPPVVRLQRHYTVDQVRYSYPLREYMPRVDLDIHFDTGSWQLTPDQIDRLSEIAAALNKAVDRNPREVYLIEGHTDAVGSPEDNLSLSDRRAEAVAVALTEQFHVPPENLVTQGYGEEHLKVPTQGPSRANRRVAVRRITPLIAQAGSQGRR